VPENVLPQPTTHHPQPTKVAFFGSPQFAVPILKSLQTAFSIPVVVTQPPKPLGRHKKITATPVAELAESYGIPILAPAKLSEPQFRKDLEPIAVDVAVVAAYGKILPRWLLDWPSRGMINVHGSILPAYRGASPIAAAIADGCSETGITFMQMSEGMDEGDVLRIYKTEISEHDTTLTVTEKLSLLAATHIADVVQDYLTGLTTSQPQPTTEVSYTYTLKAADGRIDLNNPPANLPDLIRAYYPWPGVWTEWRGKRIKFLPEGQLQMEGKRPVSLADFRRGYPEFPDIII
jgi:methionyl-tRNA formyltransferase